MHECEVCSAKVAELRRGRCWGCYARWTNERPVGLGASCCTCKDRRRDHLKSVELLGAWVPMCHNCAARAAKLSPMPRSLAGIRRALGRERRMGNRRWGKPDSRVFQYDRRGGERRRAGEGDEVELLAVDDDMIVEIQELVVELDAIAAGEKADLTRIREAPL